MMRKLQQIPPQTTFLPNIVQCSSRKDLRNSQHNTSKENLHPNRDRLSKIGLQNTQFFLPRKNQSKDYGLQLEQFLEVKLLQIQKTDLRTKPKMNQPWVAKQIDLNKETTKINRLQSIHRKENNTNLIRRKSCQNQKQTGEEGQNLAQKTLNKNKFVQLENSKILKGTTKRSISITRDKIYSCRIALKNCVFPIDPKKYQKAKLADYFDKDEQLSTINKRQDSDEEDLFISYDTLISMNL